MSFNLLKSLLPDHPILVRVWRGPLRGARVVMNPRNSLRKVLGLYEHEINGWLEVALGRVTRVVDVGANDGYFTFGCAAAFRRFGKSGEIIAFEPEARHFATLERSIHEQTKSTVPITLVQKLVGGETKPGMTKLDAITWTVGDTNDRTNTLLKIDVEGAEEEVLAGGCTGLNSSNCFLIQVHKQPYLESITRLFADKRVDVGPRRSAASLDDWLARFATRRTGGWCHTLILYASARADAQICSRPSAHCAVVVTIPRTLYLRMPSVHSGWRRNDRGYAANLARGSIMRCRVRFTAAAARVLGHRHVGAPRQSASTVEANLRERFHPDLADGRSRGQ